MLFYFLHVQVTGTVRSDIRAGLEFCRGMRCLLLGTTGTSGERDERETPQLAADRPVTWRGSVFWVTFVRQRDKKARRAECASVRSERPAAQLSRL